jgi:hypothetical protein
VLVCVAAIAGMTWVAGEAGRVGDEGPWGVGNGVDGGSPSEMMCGLCGPADMVQKGSEPSIGWL